MVERNGGEKWEKSLERWILNKRNVRWNKSQNENGDFEWMDEREWQVKENVGT